MVKDIAIHPWLKVSGVNKTAKKSQGAPKDFLVDARRGGLQPPGMAEARRLIRG